MLAATAHRWVGTEIAPPTPAGSFPAHFPLSCFSKGKHLWMSRPEAITSTWQTWLSKPIGFTNGKRWAAYTTVPALSRAGVALASPGRLHITSCQKEKKYRTSCDSLTSTFITLLKKNKSLHHAHNIYVRLSLFKKASVVKNPGLCGREQGFSKILWQLFPKPCRREWGSVSSSSQEQNLKRWAGKCLAWGHQVRSFPAVGGRHLLRAERSVLGVKQPPSLSNCPAAGALPPAWSRLQGAAAQPQPHVETLPTPSLCPSQPDQRVCWQHSQTLHPLRLPRTLGTLTCQRRQCCSRDRGGGKGACMWLGRSVRSSAVCIGPSPGLPAQPEGKSLRLSAAWRGQEVSPRLCCGGAQRFNELILRTSPR